jgi:hypothetical protein
MDRGVDLIQRLLERPLVRGSRVRVIDTALIMWFTILTTGTIVRPIIIGLKDPLGLDAIIYTEAARRLLAGENPWRTEVFDITFAAPPPSLLPYLPVVWLPDVVVGALGVGVALLSAIYAIRKLRLPMWWLLFPPTALGIAAGSSTLPMLALLVRGGVFADAAASIARVYTFLPLAFFPARWRGAGLGILVIVLTAPFLAWPTYIEERAHVAEILRDQSGGGISATAFPILIPVAIVALVLLGRRRAAWLIVPALWPNAQLHYSSIAMPVLAEMPLVAFALAAYNPGVVVAGITGQVIVDRLAGLRHRRRGS